MKITPTKSDKIALFIIIILVAGYFLYTRPQSATNFYNENDIQSISVISGNTGKTIVITDPEKISWVNNYLKKVRYSRKLFTVSRDGWGYRCTVKTSTKEADFVFSGDRCTINGSKYSMSSEKVAGVDEFYRNMHDFYKMLK